MCYKRAATEESKEIVVFKGGRSDSLELSPDLRV